MRYTTHLYYDEAENTHHIRCQIALAQLRRSNIRKENAIRILHCIRNASALIAAAVLLGRFAEAASRLYYSGAIR